MKKTTEEIQDKTAELYTVLSMAQSEEEKDEIRAMIFEENRFIILSEMKKVNDRFNQVCTMHSALKDDLFSAVSFGLYEAILKYDPNAKGYQNKGTTLYTFAHNFILGRIAEVIASTVTQDTMSVYHFRIFQKARDLVSKVGETKAFELMRKDGISEKTCKEMVHLAAAEAFPAKSVEVLTGTDSAIKCGPIDRLLENQSGVQTLIPYLDICVNDMERRIYERLMDGELRIINKIRDEFKIPRPDALRAVAFVRQKMFLLYRNEMSAKDIKSLTPKQVRNILADRYGCSRSSLHQANLPAELLQFMNGDWSKRLVETPEGALEPEQNPEQNVVPIGDGSVFADDDFGLDSEIVSLSSLPFVDPDQEAQTSDTDSDGKEEDAVKPNLVELPERVKKANVGTKIAVAIEQGLQEHIDDLVQEKIENMSIDEITEYVRKSLKKTKL